MVLQVRQRRFMLHMKYGKSKYWSTNMKPQIAITTIIKQSMGVLWESLVEKDWTFTGIEKCP